MADGVEAVSLALADPASTSAARALEPSVGVTTLAFAFTRGLLEAWSREARAARRRSESSSAFVATVAAGCVAVGGALAQTIDPGSVSLKLAGVIALVGAATSAGGALRTFASEALAAETSRVAKSAVRSEAMST
jgi:hypothetical protein